ncbi:MAG TPA: hypothetical protein VK696_02285 [Steroidobacteraceae bacterium]|nr:hypothetical protein [Steroidobacteraceae bacterium]
MLRPNLTCLAGRSLSLCLLIAHAACSAPPDSLKVIDNPGGGHVVCGPVSANTPPAAMAAVLRYLHTRFGERPLAGNVFQSRDGQNFGAFFTLTAQTATGHRIAGLVIVSMSAAAPPAGAVLYDDSSRFASTEPALMHRLTEACRSAAMPVQTTRGTKATAVPPLRPTRFPDGSGAVDLPAGWRITFASHGAATIEGPRGESVLLSNSVGPIFDPNNPQVQARLRYANPRNPPLLCPSADALQTYLCILHRRPVQPTFQLRNSRPIPPQRLAVQAVLIDAELDLHDGRGPMSCELGLAITAPGNFGRTLGVNGTCAPQASAAQEQPTLKAIYDSYSINGQIVAQEFSGDERRSREAGNNARIQANNAHAAEDAQSASFQAHMDNIDRFSKSFQNYQLDQTELQDNDQNARGAVPNSLADALIKANPDRFQSVPTQSFLRGTDF